MEDSPCDDFSLCWPSVMSPRLVVAGPRHLSWRTFDANWFLVSITFQHESDIIENHFSRSASADHSAFIIADVACRKLHQMPAHSGLTIHL